MKNNTNKFVGNTPGNEREQRDLYTITTAADSLRLELRSRAEKLLDEYMQKHIQLARNASALGLEPSYVQFFVVFHKNVLEIRWGVRTGRKFKNEQQITKFLKKDTKHGYSKSLLRKVAKPWDMELIWSTEEKLRTIRKMNTELTSVRYTKKRIDTLLHKIEEFDCG